MIDLVMSHSGRFTPNTLLQDMQHSSLDVARATLFRTLDLLTSLGYLGRVPDGEHLAYIVCDPGHHHHLVCSNCGQVIHLDECPLGELLDKLQSQTGYAISEHRLEMAGLCPTCQLGLTGGPSQPER